MAFGVYVHIPYCIQRCLYCDFATYERSQILSPEKYVDLVIKEMHARHSLFEKQPLDTIYFGGGTPSLIPPKLIVTIIKELANLGFQTGPQSELTIEINPATVSEENLNYYIENGINRFSVGAQTFNDSHLKKLGREHDAKQTIETLKLLRKYNLNFSFDILFALPNQTLEHLQKDLSIAVDLGAKHISPYCLTLPDSHLLNKNRPLDEVQIEMFGAIHSSLIKFGFNRYEISNYALPGFESKHNLLYWTDQPYWGLGLSAHSYSKNTPYGSRFWNLKSINEYEKQINSLGTLTCSLDSANQSISMIDLGKTNGDCFTSENQDYTTKLNALLEDSQYEILSEKQALTDYCHTSLRLSKGINKKDLNSKFSEPLYLEAVSRLDKLTSSCFLQKNDENWRLTDSGIYVSNQIFLEMTFIN